MNDLLILRYRQSDIRFPGDVERMQQVLAKHDCWASESDLQAAWEAYSDSYAAGWLVLPDDDLDLYEILRGRLSE